MAKKCTTCGTDGKWHLGVCRVHELVDNDIGNRMVRNCKTCGVDLCRQCFKKNPVAIARRILAFGIDLVSN